MKESKEERLVLGVFINSPGQECLRLYEQLQKIMVARRLIKPPRIRATKEEPAAK